MKIANNVALLSVGGQKAMYFVLTWDENNLALIDAGFPGHGDAIVQAIADEGFNPANLTHIFITHQDWDHVGCVKDLQKQAPNLKVLAHEEEAPYIDGQKLPIKLDNWLAKYDTLTDDERTRADSWRAVYESSPIPITQILCDGEVLPICGGIEVVHTPGHTPGHIVLYLKESNIMVCGDACNINAGKLTGSNPVYTFDMNQATASLEKIKSYKPMGIVAYHGGFLKMDGEM